MIQIGNTIVIKNGNGLLGFYWLCDIRQDGYLFFDWYGNPLRPSSSDYILKREDWLVNGIKNHNIEVYDSLPLEKYGDIFEQQAIDRSQKTTVFKYQI